MRSIQRAGRLQGGIHVDTTAIVIRTAGSRVDRKEANREWKSLEEATDPGGDESGGGGGEDMDQTTGI